MSNAKSGSIFLHSIKAVLLLCLKIIVIGLVVIVGGFISNKPSEHTYNATFGNAWEQLSRFNHGIAVTVNKAITKVQAHTNVALLGPTGSGKSSTVIICSAASLSRG